MVWPDFQPMRVPEEPVFIFLFRKNPVFTSLRLKSPVRVVHTWRYIKRFGQIEAGDAAKLFNIIFVIYFIPATYDFHLSF